MSLFAPPPGPDLKMQGKTLIIDKMVPSAFPLSTVIVKKKKKKNQPTDILHNN